MNLHLVIAFEILRDSSTPHSLLACSKFNLIRKLGTERRIAFDNGYNIRESISNKIYRIFSVCAPPPPSTLCAPQLQSTCHYIVNHFLKIWHVRLGGANNMRPLNWGGTNVQDPIYLKFAICTFSGNINI